MEALDEARVDIRLMGVLAVRLSASAGGFSDGIAQLGVFREVCAQARKSLFFMGAVLGRGRNVDVFRYVAHAKGREWMRAAARLAAADWGPPGGRGHGCAMFGYAMLCW
ncbi:MAG: hypothetical protein ACODAD_02355 [Planctomycetota bacterium]